MCFACDLNTVHYNTELQTFCESFLFEHLIKKAKDDFEVSVAVFLWDANSGQISIKCRHLAYNVESPPLINCKNLSMKLEVKYLFSNSVSSASFYIYQLPEGLGMSKILTHGIRMQKNPETRVDIFWILTDSHGVQRV